MDYAEVLKELAGAGANFAVAGGFACLAHGVVRVTLDLDLVVELSDRNLKVIWDTLTGLDFMTRQPVAREDAVSAEKLAALSRAKGMQALSWIHREQPFLIVDLLIGEGFRWSPEKIQEMSLFGAPHLVLKREELIHLKRLAGREKDLVDVRELERLD